jgi:hypothetical protein
MSVHRHLVLTTMLLAPALAAAAERHPDHFRILYAEAVQFDDSATRADANSRVQAKRSRFDAYGRRFELALERNERLQRAVATADGPDVYRGTLAGVPGSWARLTIANGRRYGMVWDGRDLYVIEPAADAAANLAGTPPARGADTVVYRLSDTLAPANGATCATARLPAPAGEPADAARAQRSGLDSYRALVGELQAASGTPSAGATAAATAGVAGATQRLQVNAVADYEYVRQVGATLARDRIVARFNNIDGIFASQAGVQIELAGPVQVYETPDQPFTATDPSALLGEVGNFRQRLVSTASAQAGGLTHLVTGRDLDGTTVGIAYIGALCSARYGVSLSEGLNSFGDLIAAHELGHNFGAPHDGEVPTGAATNACQTVPQDYLMAPRINGSRVFSQCSLEQMAPQIARATCLLPAVVQAPAVDVGVTAGGATLRAYLQRPVTLAATVTNTGTGTATNARLQFTLPATLEAQGATANPGGTCTLQAGGASCTWPTLGAGAVAEVQLALRGTVVGAQSIVARTQADGDASTSNDQATWQVAIDPLPDLALEIPRDTATTTVEQSATLTVSVRNPGAAAADGGTVRFEMPTVVSPTPLPAGCTLSGAVANCAVGPVAPGSTVTLELPIRGVAAGSGSARVALQSNDDASGANNVGAIGVTVAAAQAPVPAATSSSPASASGPTTAGSGGGGSFGLAGLLALLGLPLLRARTLSARARQGRC